MMPCSDTACNVSQAERRERAAERRKVGMAIRLLCRQRPGINMWVGVTRAGYSITDEAPIFIAIFAVPAAPAGYLWWTLSRG
jgi:hypothetical protein